TADKHLLDRLIASTGQIKIERALDLGNGIVRHMLQHLLYFVLRAMGRYPSELEGLGFISLAAQRLLQGTGIVIAAKRNVSLKGTQAILDDQYGHHAGPEVYQGDDLAADFFVIVEGETIDQG